MYVSYQQILVFQDIRSFFQLKKTPKPTVEDDDDVIPESPDVQITKPKVLKKHYIQKYITVS